MAKIKKTMKGGAKGGKGGGKKGKSNESDEERQMRLEAERLREEEARRAMEAMRKEMIKKRLAQEERYSRINNLKINTRWRTLMRLVKTEDLRKEIEILSQQHEREVDRKDAMIQMFDTDLEDAEEQYQVALRSHLLSVDKLIDLHNARLKDAEAEFERDMQILADEFGEERREMEATRARNTSELHEILAVMEHEFQEEEAAAQAEFESAREEIKNKASEEYNVLRFTLDGLIEELERHFDAAHANYTSSTEQRTADFKALTLKDQQSAKTIETQARRLQRLHDQTSRWKGQLAANAQECEGRNRALKGEREALSRHFQELKGRMNRFRDAEGGRLMEVTLNSQAAAKALREKLAKAERILRLAEVTRKLETEREKVLPFYESSVEEETRAASSAAEMVKSLQATATARDGSVVEEWDYLGNFFQRYNKVLLDATAMQRERGRLAAENADLRSILKQYLDGISVNDEVLSAPNPLLVVNSRSAVVEGTKTLPIATTVIEASHVAMQVTSGRQGASY
mmetsp:Transcript_36392/g.107967  ORF Transcript_36392/g.107967 Transcript_36392/m.107967 type:complete len:517 (-) Transcript_36392:77-1627(-)